MALYKNIVKKISVPADKKTKQKEYLPNGRLPIVDQGHELIGGYTEDLSKQIDCQVPVMVFGDHTKCVKLINFDFGAGADGIKIIQPKDDTLNIKYLYYATKYLTLRIRDKGYARHYQFIEKQELNVPSLDEQQLIVARIEELFSSLDNAVETLQKTKEQLTVYRQAVLKEAFEKCPEHVSIESITHHVTDGDHMPPPKADAGIPFIMISNIYGNVICWDNTAFVGKEYFEKIDSKRKPQKGDVLYTVTGSYGIPVLVDCNKDFCFQRHIALLRPNETVTQKYLYYSLMEPNVFSQATKGATGTAQKTVGLGVLRKIKIPFIKGLTEQVKIVEEIEAKLSMCDSIEQTVNAALAQAEAMRQSILKEAFEGRL